MAEKALVSMAQQFSGLPMDSLIGGPLNAAANANAAMAMTQTKFLLDTCFRKDGDNYAPIMIKMSLTRGVLSPGDPAANPPVDPIIQSVTTSFDLPILTIIPLNSLAVDNVDVTFEMEVKSSYGEEQSESSRQRIQASAEWEVKAGWGPVSVSITGRASYDKEDTSNFSSHYEKSNSAKYTVAVHAGQLPLPKGVNTIIEAYAQAIEPVTLPTTGGQSNKGNKGGNP